MAGLAQRQAYALIVIAALVGGIPPARAYDTDAAARAFRVPSASARPVTVRRGWQGSDSAIAERGFERIVELDGWNVLWRRHAPGTAAPAVDFDTEMVLAIFGGKSAAGSELSLYAVAESEVLEVITMSYGYDVVRSGSSNPYLIVVLPRSGRTVTHVARGYCLMCGPQLQYRVVQELPELRMAR
jgi:hypothetical protein